MYCHAFVRAIVSGGSKHVSGEEMGQFVTETSMHEGREQSGRRLRRRRVSETRIIRRNN
jgi:hypothetical protein